MSNIITTAIIQQQLIDAHEREMEQLTLTGARANKNILDSQKESRERRNAHQWRLIAQRHKLENDKLKQILVRAEDFAKDKTLEQKGLVKAIVHLHKTCGNSETQEILASLDKLCDLIDDKSNDVKNNEKEVKNADEEFEKYVRR